MGSIFDLVSLRRWRARLRSLVQRVEQLEKRLRETEAVVDIVVTDAVFKPDPDVGMNGQQKRKEIVRLICDCFRPELAIETGTFFGSTTGYLATLLNVPVISSEIRSRYYHVARRILRNLPNVDVRLQDSRSLLREVATDANLTGKRTFFYLDAHWYDDLPLADELDIIASHWPEFVAVIDDFQVPDAPEYGYDDYGEGRRLDLSLIDVSLKKHDLKALFPRAPAQEETGQRRGCCVIVRRRSVAILEGTRPLLLEGVAPTMPTRQ